MKTEKFGNTAIALHWLTAILVVASVTFGLIHTGTSDQALTRSSLINHQSIGLIILVLVLGRIAWRIVRPAPPLPTSIPRVQRWIAIATHYLLYLCLAVMSLSGFASLAARGRAISFFGLFDLPESEFVDFELSRLATSIHDASQYALYILVGIHFIGALYHQFFVEENILKRMWFGRIQPAQRAPSP